MMEETLIKPIIFFGPGQCPYCSGVLMVVDSEISCMILGPDGMPIKEDTMIRCEAVCQSCGSKIKMMRHGFGYRYYSKTYKLFEKYNIEQKRKLTHTQVEGNPFFEKNNKDA